MIVASTNVPLGIDDAATIDLAAHAPEVDVLWGDDSDDPDTGDPP